MTIMDMDILSFVILVVMGLVVGFGALIVLCRGLKKSVGSSVVIAISLLAAAIATAIIFAPKEETIASISNLVSELIGNSTGRRINSGGTIDLNISPSAFIQIS